MISRTVRLDELKRECIAFWDVMLQGRNPCLCSKKRKKEKAMNPGMFSCKGIIHI